MLSSSLFPVQALAWNSLLADADTDFTRYTLSGGYHLGKLALLGDELQLDEL